MLSLSSHFSCIIKVQHSLPVLLPFPLWLFLLFLPCTTISIFNLRAKNHVLFIENLCVFFLLGETKAHKCNSRERERGAMQKESKTIELWKKLKCEMFKKHHSMSWNRNEWHAVTRSLRSLSSDFGALCRDASVRLRPLRKTGFLSNHVNVFRRKKCIFFIFITCCSMHFRCNWSKCRYLCLFFVRVANSRFLHFSEKKLLQFSQL